MEAVAAAISRYCIPHTSCYNNWETIRKIHTAFI